LLVPIVPELWYKHQKLSPWPALDRQAGENDRQAGQAKENVQQAQAGYEQCRPGQQKVSLIGPLVVTREEFRTK